MENVALVTLLLVCQYMVFFMLVGAARGKSGLKAPAVTGDENFERAYRVQMNTLEQLMVVLPALWVSGIYFDSLVAALLGMAFFLGRVIYRASYVKNPEGRGIGFVIGFLAELGLVGTGLWGVISAL